MAPKDMPVYHTGLKDDLLLYLRARSLLGYSYMCWLFISHLLLQVSEKKLENVHSIDYRRQSVGWEGDMIW